MAKKKNRYGAAVDRGYQTKSVPKSELVNNVDTSSKVNPSNLNPLSNPSFNLPIPSTIAASSTPLLPAENLPVDSDVKKFNQEDLEIEDLEQSFQASLPYMTNQVSTDQIKLAKKFQTLAQRKIDRVNNMVEQLNDLENRSDQIVLSPNLALNPKLYEKLTSWVIGQPFLVTKDEEDQGYSQPVEFRYPHLPFSEPYLRHPQPALITSQAMADRILSQLYECEVYALHSNYSLSQIRPAIAYLGSQATLSLVLDFIVLKELQNRSLGNNKPIEQAVDVQEKILSLTPPRAPSPKKLLTERQGNNTHKMEQEILSSSDEESEEEDDDNYLLDPNISYHFARNKIDSEIFQQLLNTLLSTPPTCPLHQHQSQIKHYLKRTTHRANKIKQEGLCFNEKEAKYHEREMARVRLERAYELKSQFSLSWDLDIRQAKQNVILEEKSACDNKEKEDKSKVMLAKNKIKEEKKGEEEEDDTPISLDDLFKNDEDNEVRNATNQEISKNHHDALAVSLKISKGWTGKLPRDLILGLCRSKKAEMKFVTNKNYETTLTVTRNSPTEQLNYSSLQPPLNHGPLLVPQNKIESENLAATIGLFHLNWLSTSSILAPPFQALYAEWVADRAMKQELDRDRVLLDRYEFMSNTMGLPDTSNSSTDNAGNVNIRGGDLKSKQTNDKDAPKRAYWNSKNLIKEGDARFNSKGYLQHFATRKELPIHQYRSEIVECVNRHRVQLIVGATGCGKTTQVPQFLVEEMLRGVLEPGQIVCTQPRRISAISIAQRISAELGDSQGPGSPKSLVGYQVRLGSKTASSNLLTLCTLGVLLRRMERDPNLHTIRHLVIDEIQERSLDSDLLLLLVKRLLISNSNLTVTLMSATINAQQFVDYFDYCPVIQVPGRTFPVVDYYMEDIITHTRYAVPDQDNPANTRHYGIDYELIVHLLRSTVVAQSCPQLALPPGAILIFLPGVPEIKQLTHYLQLDRDLGNTARFLIVSAHSGVPPEAQAAIFDVPPPTIARKIVLATNVAETGITIPDVTVVIDSGWMKQIQFDVKLQVRQLVPTLISQANAKQRAGRAGRVQPGTCLRLFSQAQFATMAPYPSPEILRVPLEELCLKVISLNPSGLSLNTLLGQAIQPPPPNSVTRAVANLLGAGAITKHPTASGHQLTALGRHLVNLPVSIEVGKLILHGVLFRCVDPTLTIGALMGLKSIFLPPSTGGVSNSSTSKNPSHAIPAKWHRAGCDWSSQYSVYCEWRNRMSQHGTLHGQKFCESMGLNWSVLVELEELKRQYLQLLVAGHFLPSTKPSTKPPNSLLCYLPPPDFDTNGHCSGVIKCCLVAALYPRVLWSENRTGLLLKPPPLARSSPVAAHSDSKEAGELGYIAKLLSLPTSSSTTKLVVRPTPQSIHRKPTRSHAYPFAVYASLMKATPQTLSSDAITLVSPLPVLLFSQELLVVHRLGLAICDRYIKLQASPALLAMINQMRLRIQIGLESLVTIAPPHCPATNRNHGADDPNEGKEDWLAMLVSLLEGLED